MVWTVIGRPGIAGKIICGLHPALSDFLYVLRATWWQMLPPPAVLAVTMIRHTLSVYWFYLRSKRDIKGILARSAVFFADHESY